jgi:hypothetical protein
LLHVCHELPGKGVSLLGVVEFSENDALALCCELGEAEGGEEEAR